MTNIKDIIKIYISLYGIHDKYLWHATFVIDLNHDEITSWIMIQ